MRVFDISPEMPPAATGGISMYDRRDMRTAVKVRAEAR